MTKFFEFSTHEYSRDCVPEHAQESIENYLIYGYDPGGFMSAMFAGNLFCAASSADQANGPSMQGIANWIMHSAPVGSYGNRQNVRDWIQDKDGIRTKFADKMEKEFIVRTLKA